MVIISINIVNRRIDFLLCDVAFDKCDHVATYSTKLNWSKLHHSGSDPERCILAGLEGSAFAYLASKVWVEGRKPLVIVCSDAARAGALLDDISYFSQSVAPGPVKIFSAPTTLPYTHLIPQPDTWIERLGILYTMENESAPMIIAPVNALLRKVPPREAFYDHIEYVALGQDLNRDLFLKTVVAAGYNNSPLVEEEGDFAGRGYIIDIWSPVYDRPVRIELDGDTVASIRSFDPATQRTSYTIDRVTIIPVRSVMLDEDVVSKGLANLKRRSDDIGFSVVERRAFAGSIKSGIYPAYTETLLPVFHPNSCWLWDYLKEDTMIFVEDPVRVREVYEKFWGELTTAYGEAGHIEKVVRPEDLYKKYDGWLEVLERRPCIKVNDLEISPPPGGCVTRVITSRAHPAHGRWIEGSSESSLSAFVGQLNSWLARGLKIILVCHTSIMADRLIDLLRWQGMAPVVSDRSFRENITIASVLPPQGGGEDASPPLRGGDQGEGGIFITIGTLSEGFVWPDEGIAVLSETEMFGKKRKRIPRAATYPTETFASYQDLSDGDLLVHIQHGVGRYRGMKQLEFSGMKNDFLQLEYLGGDKLYIPAYRLNLVQKYVGAGAGSPYIDKMGGKRWERAKLKASRAVRKMAAELLKLYAARTIREGFAFSGRDHLMEEFEAAFPYDETPDQMTVIEDVIKDMSDPNPVDRLICGDVGYGKTEVAMRAAFRAAMDGKQVAVLVPTTILAFQHNETFKERFKGTPVNIQLLNRFKSGKEQTEVVKGVEKGEVDIVIGTHRLLQKDVVFRDLGLLIIDEEHRFGVRQKETIKKLRETVDVLSMSATPIPRSLHISLVGARDISVINTPPADRLSIRTYVAEFDEGLIRGAILKELRREGQVFFVHNRVETIESMRGRLAALVPEAKIVVAHGQMKEHELEKVMVAFLKKDFNVLLTTTIIESGLDIPSANTLIVNRADTFGLAQLYQLRGRVGRSNVQAFAYLLIPDEASITSVASKRLAALQKYTELGSGFQIAMHDLEIRGAGNILGAQQSGHISAIGYELYTELLEREVKKLKGEEETVEIDTEILIPVEAYLPATYIEDDGTRLIFYKRISALKEEADIDQMAGELKDRFGDLPNVASNLLKVVEIKLRASKLGIESVQCVRHCEAAAEATPHTTTNFIYRTPSGVKSFVEDVELPKELFTTIRKHLTQLSVLS